MFLLHRHQVLVYPQPRFGDDPHYVAQVIGSMDISQWTPNCRIVYDKFHIMQHAAAAVDEVRRAEFFRKGGASREVVQGKRWLLLSRWVHLDTNKNWQLNELFTLNRRVIKAYLLKESLDRLWSYTYEGAMRCYLQSWIDQAAETHGEAGADIAGSPGWHPELLPDQDTDGRGRSGQWEHQRIANDADGVNIVVFAD
jgi:hypothetical protein